MTSKLLSFRKRQLIQKLGCKCTRCGAVTELTIDHIVPLAEGGTDDEKNLRVLCFKCNVAKGNIPPLLHRLRHLIDGNWYRFKNEIRGEVGSRLTDMALLLENLSSENQSLKDQIRNLNQRFNEQDGIKQIVEFNRKEQIANQNKLAERIHGLEKINQVEWMEEKIIEFAGYKKSENKNKTKNPTKAKNNIG